MEIGDIHVTVVKRDLKNPRIEVLPPDGRVEVIALEEWDDEDIYIFVSSNLAKIRCAQRQMAKTVREQPRDVTGNETHYYLGSQYRLRVEEKTNVQHEVVQDGEWLIMTVHPGTNKKNRNELLWEFYRSQLKNILTEMVEKKCKEYGEEDVTWEIKRMRTEWGSCMAKRRHLLFNLELARLPLRCIEYIVVHELTHLQEKTHSRRFSDLMDSRLPMWRSIRSEMNDFPATHFEYTPDWKKEISRIGDIINERSILNLSVILGFLKLSHARGVENEDFVLDASNKELKNQYESLCPIGEKPIDKAIAECGDAEFYKRIDDAIAIKALWVNALEDREFLEDVIKHCEKVLDKVSAKYGRSAAHIEPIEDFTEDNEQLSKLSRDRKTLVRVSSKMVTFEIPDGVRIIGQGAFAGCINLVDAKIPLSVVRIESGAFRGCSALEEINVPASVMKVASDAFENSGIDQAFADEIYHNQGYYTPSVVDSLPPINVLVYTGKEDASLAMENFGAKTARKAGRDGSSYMIPVTANDDDFADSVEAFIAYARDNQNVRFVVRQSVIAEHPMEIAKEAFEAAYALDNVIMPFDLYNAVDDLVNSKVLIDSVARYKFGGIINFSYVVNAIKVSSDPKENERVQELVTEYNKEHAKDMLFPLCKRFNTGMSIHPNAGLYIGDSDQYYDEGSFEVKIIGVRSSQLKKIASEICSMFIQESVLVKDEVQNTVYFLKTPVMNVKEHPALKKKK